MYIYDLDVTKINREEAYLKFRQFSKDALQEGGTLASSSPLRFSGTKSLIAKRAYYTRLAYRPDKKVIAISLLLPSELCWAAGYIPFNWEMFSSLLASHSKVIEITNKGSAPVPRCSFINSLKGSYLSGILPNPDATISSSAFCEGIGYMFNELSRLFRVSHFHVDIPGYYNKTSLNNLSCQLNEVFKNLCLLNNIPLKQGYDNLRKAIYYSVLAKMEYYEICRLRKIHKTLNLGFEPLHWHFVFSNMWGEESSYHICRKLKDEILNEIQLKKDKIINDKGIPIGIFSLIPYGRTNLWDKLIDSGAYLTFEGINYLGNYFNPNISSLENSTEKEMFDYLAENLINIPMRSLDTVNNADNLMQYAKDTGTKGLIIFAHEHCQMLAPRLELLEKSAADNGLKVVSISGDCILGMPSGPTSIRLDTFLSSISNNNNKREHFSETIKINVENELRLGIDFGSGYSKYVILDKKNNLIKYDIINSGIDYPQLLEEIKFKIGDTKNIGIAIAGVGSDNPDFKELINYQTTEINALIKAINIICADYHNFIVIDIGTQDVKILKFNDSNEIPWVNTNKSCGAGTGMVLVQILERWQKSNPEISFSDLDQMADEAEKSVLINTTCGIFAVTNVVSSLIQSNTNKRREILRGVYEYLAEQAIRLLPHHKKANTNLLLTGGLAEHKTLRKIFIEKGFKLIALPKDLHAQYVVAYGSALSIN